MKCHKRKSSDFDKSSPRKLVGERAVEIIKAPHVLCVLQISREELKLFDHNAVAHNKS